MANYCPNCGTGVDSSASFCPNCGSSLNGGTYTNQNSTTSNTGNILGTLVAVSLIGGLTRQLYYYNGRYFLDPYCRRPFGSPHMILGRPRPMGMHPMPGMRPMPPHGGPRGGGFHGGGPHGGPRGGGPHGGGPRGGHR